MRLTLSFLFLGILFSVVTSALAEGEDDLKGEWEVISFTGDGEEIPKDKSPIAKLVFDKTKLTMTGDQKPKEFSYKLNASKKPKQMDLTPLSGPFKDKTTLAIYELSGDTLKLCVYNKESKERPAEFKSEKGSSLGLLILKRIK